MVIAEGSTFQDCTEPRPQLERLDDHIVRVRAAAKLNLSLAVGAEGPDGYHAFESLMTTVTLFDEMTIKSSAEPGIRISCDNDQVPADCRNLAYRACSLLAWMAKISPAVDIDQRKRIPNQAGLGGGSSDAAACLVALNALWGLHFHNDELLKLAAVLGSDVSFFLRGPLAVCSGHGERVDPLDCTWDFWAVVICPQRGLSTGKVYKSHRLSDPSCFGLAGRLAEQLAENVPSAVSGDFQNDLELAAFRVDAELARLSSELQAIADSPVRLSGSGSAMFALFDTRREAVQFVQRIRQLYPELAIWLVRNNAW